MTIRAVIVLFGISLLTSACDQKLSEIAGPTPNLEPTFSSIQREIFSAADASGRPACTQCHNASAAAGLNLTEGVAYSQLVQVASRQKPGLARVTPSNPDVSYLLHKIEGRADMVGQRMPRGTATLTEGQIRIIRRWIELGARND